MRRLFRLLQFLHHLAVAVSDERQNEVVFKPSVQSHLVPVFLVPVPCTINLIVRVAQVKGVVGVAFQSNKVGTLQIDASEYFAEDTEHKGCLVEREVFSHERKR